MVKEDLSFSLLQAIAMKNLVSNILVYLDIGRLYGFDCASLHSSKRSSTSSCKIMVVARDKEGALTF
jgi:hypothetical protein